MSTQERAPRINFGPFLAVEVLAQLACRDENSPIKTEWLAGSISRSISYTELLMRRLRRAGFVRARKGSGGGYFLSRHPNSITIAEVFQALDDPSKPCGWLFKPSATPASRINALQGTELLWESLRSYIFLFLSGISLADVAPTDDGGRLSRPVESSSTAHRHQSPVTLH